MAHSVAINLTWLRLPARSTLSITAASSSIKAEASNDEEGVSIADVNRDPISFAFLTVIEKSARDQVTLEESRFA